MMERESYLVETESLIQCLHSRINHMIWVWHLPLILLVKSGLNIYFACPPGNHLSEWHLLIYHVLCM